MALQDFSLENPMDRGAWQATVHGVSKSWMWLNKQYLRQSRFIGTVSKLYPTYTKK